MLCQRCRKEIADLSLFCCHCGKKQSAAQERHKREHGTGTISIDPRYRNCFIVHAPAAGDIKKRTYLGAYPTWECAEKVLDEYIRKGCPDLFNATVGDIYSMWSSAHFRQISEKTANCYRSTWTHFEPITGMRMSEVRATHIQSIVNAHPGAGVSGCIKTLAKALCQYAMENDILDKNYAEFVKLPKSKKVEKMTFTTDQIAILWRNTHDPNVQAIIVMIYMGFRIGEMILLTTDSINMNDSYIIGGIKTDAGKERLIPFPPNIPEIREFVSEWIGRALPGGRLFPMTEHTFRNKVFYTTLIRLGMLDAHISKNGAVIFHTKRHLTPHSTRHTFASLSVAAGMQPERLQKIIGHASYRTTADYYVHIEKSALTKEMGKLVKNCT